MQRDRKTDQDGNRKEKTENVNGDQRNGTNPIEDYKIS